MIHHSLETIPPLSPPFALTLGFFDGLHKGHRKLLSALKQKGTPSAVLTFSNHPGAVLSAKEQPPLLSSPEYKAFLFQEEKIDCLLLIPFTKEFASIPYDSFLRLIRSKIPFTHLLLGKGAAFGQNRLGNEKNVKEMGKREGFEVAYIEKDAYQDEVISSSKIRKLVQEGNLQEASLLLERPFSIYLPSVNENPDLSSLCLPPNGSYQGILRQNEQKKRISFSIENRTLQTLSPIWEGFQTHQPLLLEFLWQNSLAAL